MFVESTTQEDLFKSTAGMMEGKRRKAYEDKKVWHNQFREQVTNKIDETIFKPLYSAEHGAPNAAIRVSIGMMILKTGQETSDEYLFEESRFNMLTRAALGLVNGNLRFHDDEPPTESTYYLLRQKIVDYEKENGVNLFDKMFKEFLNPYKLSCFFDRIHFFESDPPEPIIHEHYHEQDRIRVEAHLLLLRQYGGKLTQ